MCVVSDCVRVCENIQVCVCECVVFECEYLGADM